jgi:glutamate N-acetyltransferase/amino-acid N-acetyltransferase
MSEEVILGAGQTAQKISQRLSVNPFDKPSIAKTPGTKVSPAKLANIGGADLDAFCDVGATHEITFIEGGLGNILGIKCAGVSAGFRRNPERKDLALIVADKPTVTAGVFTKNLFCAAPVTLSRQHLASAATRIRAIVLNSGNANASTGEPGMKTAIRTTEIVAKHLDCALDEVLVASTGVIGVPLKEDPFENGIALAIRALDGVDGSAGDEEALAFGLSAAEAIMTTDTHPKQAAVTFTLAQNDGSTIDYKVGGMVKGSGMIQPDMATMLGVLATDAPLTQAAADLALRKAVNATLNKVTVDSDTSTNDSGFFMASGAAGGETIEAEGSAFAAVTAALIALGEDLARQIAYDGEGATRLVTVQVAGAKNTADADLAARAVANSPLVKTAIAGHDANWGRIAMAIGKSGASFEQENVSISIMGMSVCEDGLPVPFDEEEALRRFEQESEIVINIYLGAGSAQTTVWSCDLTHGYISINGDYRS